MIAPISSADFVGRSTELAEITGLLSDPACRLLTLVGPGGIGKTRLALEAARQLPLPENTHFVALQPLASAEFIVSAIADSVGFQFYSGSDPKQQLLDYLREKSWLLLLDNFEHLLDGATLLSEILANATGIRILVTSRERLNLVEEWVLEVGGLAYPISANDSQAGRYSAVELFALRAQRVNVGFVLNEAQRPAVVRICRLVGGMPLGIELAASWTRALSCEAIADEIERSLDILETPARNVEPRHRTMRAAFAPTWNRLSDEERAVFMKLSVFRGGCTREAAEQVAGASLRILSTLVDQSLLRVDANGRYDIHELLRQYAQEKLLDSGELETTMQAHLDYFLKFAEQVEAHNFGREQIFWYDRVEVELDNLRMALSWSLETETSLQLAAALGWFFSERCHWNEGLAWLERLLTANLDAPLSLRSKALHTMGALVSHLMDPQRARALCEEALALARAANDPLNIAWALSQLATHGAMNAQQAMPLLQESLALFREQQDAMGLCHTLIRAALRANAQQTYAYRRSLIDEALVIATEADDKIMLGWTTYLLGEDACFQTHDLKRAKTYFEFSLSPFREAQFRWATANVLSAQAHVELMMQDDVHAELHYREALLLLQKWQLYYDSIEDCLLGLADIAILRGQFLRAVQLLGASEAVISIWNFKKSTGWPLVDNFPFTVAELRAQLGETAFAEPWTIGKAMTRRQAIVFALEGSAPLDTLTATAPADSEKSQSAPLSQRELEVLRLIADGLSNGEIADQLVLAKSTIKWYVNEIFSKLDATSRTQAVARAKTLGLLS